VVLRCILQITTGLATLFLVVNFLDPDARSGLAMVLPSHRHHELIGHGVTAVLKLEHPMRMASLVIVVAIVWAIIPRQ
jgi:hypothetical protein